MTEDIPRSDAKLIELALDSIDQGFVVWDDDYNLIICNKTFQNIWGYPDSLVKPGTSARELLAYDAQNGFYGDSDVEDIVEQRFKDAVEHINTKLEQFKMVNDRVLFIRRFSVKDFGSVTTFTDITELKEVEAALEKSETELKERIKDLQDREQQLEKQARTLETLTDNLLETTDGLEILNAQKDKLFSIIAHDLKGPFNTLLGFTEILATDAISYDKETTIATAKDVHSSAVRVYKLLENLLEWSRLQMGGCPTTLFV